MKNIFLLLIFLINIQSSFAQNPAIDQMMDRYIVEKDANKRIDIFYHSTVLIGESNPALGLEYAHKLLEYSEQNNDKIGEGYAKSFMGKMYTVSGNLEKGLEYAVAGKTIAEQTDNEKLIALTNSMLGLIYTNLADYTKAIQFYQASIQSAEKANYQEAKVWGFQHLSEIYLANNQIDSALMYGQKDYSLSQRIKYFDFASYTLNNLGAIHAKMGNPVVAIGYFDMAIQEGEKTNSAKQLNFAYTSKSEYFNSEKNIDSTVFYAKKAIDIVQHTPFSNYSLKPARILLEVYKKNNSDSALKYSEIYRMANDSLNNAKVIQQTQLISFVDEQKQKELAANKIKAEENRQETIQYALIALGIIVLLVIYLILSRSFITKPGLIHFFGVIALLLVFEFLNLLLHPLIGRITHHSPLLMLLGLVCIGALLVPLHHKVEKWATTRLVEKNKQIRLAAARKTIKELETQTDMKEGNI
jgi:tetratricopeptide (TPR) repeat protein